MKIKLILSLLLLIPVINAMDDSKSIENNNTNGMVAAFLDDIANGKLITAMMTDDLEAFDELMVKEGADVNTQNQELFGTNLFMLACGMRKTKFVKHLIDYYGAKKNAIINGNSIIQHIKGLMAPIVASQSFLQNGKVTGPLLEVFINTQEAASFELERHTQEEIEQLKQANLKILKEYSDILDLLAENKVIAKL